MCCQLTNNDLAVSVTSTLVGGSGYSKRREERDGRSYSKLSHTNLRGLRMIGLGGAGDSPSSLTVCTVIFTNCKTFVNKDQSTMR